MERKKYLIMIMLITNLTFAQSEYQKCIYNAYINNDMNLWKKTIDKMYKEKSKSNEFLLELINYHYGYIGWCVGNDKKNEAKNYLERANILLEILEKRKYNFSYINSYKSAFYGFEMGIYWYKIPFLGPKSVEAAKNAIKLDDNNPFGYIELGHAEYYMPKAFGGSKIKALEYFEKALKIMENSKYYTAYNWNYLNLLTKIGKTYFELGNYQMAKIYFEKILKIEPNYHWVKNELFPLTIKKLG